MSPYPRSDEARYQSVFDLDADDFRGEPEAIFDKSSYFEPDPREEADTEGQSITSSQYVASGGARCPFCLNNMLDKDPYYKIVGRTLRVIVACIVCEEEWEEVYEMKGIDTGDSENLMSYSYEYNTLLGM